MKIEFIRSQDPLDYGDAYVIAVDGTNMLSFFDGEPEDNSLCRNFSDVYSIIDLVKLIENTINKGEDIECIQKTVEWKEL